MYLAKKYGARCHGITLSPYLVQKATELTAAQGLAEKVSFQVADATEQPFPDGQSDLVWSIECLEHVNEKKKVPSFLQYFIYIVIFRFFILFFLVCNSFSKDHLNELSFELK